MEREEEGKKKGMKKENEGKYEEWGKKLLEEIPSASLQSLISDVAFPQRVLEFSTILQFLFCLWPDSWYFSCCLMYMKHYNKYSLTWSTLYKFQFLLSTRRKILIGIAIMTKKNWPFKNKRAVPSSLLIKKKKLK